jgi:hypothetical protein
VSTITIWMIIVTMNSGHRVELPNPYHTEVECLAVAQSTQNAHRGASAACVTRAIAVSEERARQWATEAWTRNQPIDSEADDRKGYPSPYPSPR